MAISPDYFRTICDVWITLAVVFVALIILTIFTFQRSRKMWSLRRLGKAQAGAAYSMAMVATLPIYAILICMIVECTLTLQVKLGTMYAAYAAARSAAVYCPAEIPAAEIERKVKTAATQALLPFASSRDCHLQDVAATDSGDIPEAEELYEAYVAYCEGPITLQCLTDKLKYAWLATHVSIEQSSEGPTANLSVTVRYRMPFHTGIGYLLGGERSPSGRTFRVIETTVTLQKEGVKSATQELGIHYDPDHDG